MYVQAFLAQACVRGTMPAARNGVPFRPGFKIIASHLWLYICTTTVCTVRKPLAQHRLHAQQIHASALYPHVNSPTRPLGHPHEREKKSLCTISIRRVFSACLFLFVMKLFNFWNVFYFINKTERRTHRRTRKSSRWMPPASSSSPLRACGWTPLSSR